MKTGHDAPLAFERVVMKSAAILLLTALTAGCASRGTSAEGDERISFVSSNGILEWKAAGRDSLHVQSNSGQWYLVWTLGGCPRLKTAITLGFDTSAGDTLMRGDALLAEGQRCPIASISRIPPPGPEGD